MGVKKQRPGGGLPFYAPRPEGWQPDPLPCLNGVDTLYLDAETTGTAWHKGAKPVGWAWATPDGRSGYAPFGHEGGGNLPEDQVKAWMCRELHGKHIVNLYTKFDLHMARAGGVDLTEQHNTFRDVAHSEALLDDWHRGFSLEALSQKRLGRGKGALEVEKADIHTAPAWVVAPYATVDAENVRDLDRIYRPLLAAEGLEGVHALEDALIPATVEMEKNGCPLDEELLARWLAESEQQLADLSWESYRALGFKVNPDSNEDLIRLFAHLGIVNPHRTKPTDTHPNGQVSFTADYLKTIEHPDVQRVYRLGKLVDVRAKFLIPYTALLHDGKLWPTFHQLMTDEGGTISGRYSCSNPNVQQVTGKDKYTKDYVSLDLPYEMRRLFRPARGAWLCADQSQVEYRLAVHFAAMAAEPCDFSAPARANVEHFLQMYRDNPRTDYHQVVGAMVEKFRPGLTRTETKTTNFMKLFGAKYKGIGKKLKINEREAMALVLQYDTAFPVMKELLEACERRAGEQDFVTSILGRRCRFHGQRLYAALNRVIQPSAADIFKTNIVATYERRKEFGLTLRMVVHDEIGGDVEDPSVLPMVQAFLDEQRVETLVPVLWDAKVGSTWADAK